MKVSLQHITPDAELEIVRIARVSSKREDKDADAEKLIRYLIKHKHWSPFDMASMCIDVECTVAVSIQILRHWSIKFQQFSQRYAEVDAFEPIQFYYQDETHNRQMSTSRIFDNVELLERVDRIQSETMQLYADLIDAGCSRETARYILPMNAKTRLYMHGTIRSWIHYLEVRNDSSHVQPEHVQIAQQIAEIFKQNLPNIYKACQLR